MSGSQAIAQLEGARPALVPPGNYEVAFCGYTTCVLFGKAQKLNLQFRITTMGEHFEARLSRYYNVARLIGRPRVNGRFKVGFHSDFLREFVRLFGVPTRLDRIPMSHFERRLFLARVRTVEKGGDQAIIPIGLRYSVISDLLGIQQ